MSAHNRCQTHLLSYVQRESGIPRRKTKHLASGWICLAAGASLEYPDALNFDILIVSKSSLPGDRTKFAAYVLRWEKLQKVKFPSDSETSAGCNGF